MCYNKKIRPAWSMRKEVYQRRFDVLADGGLSLVDQTVELDDKYFLRQFITLGSIITERKIWDEKPKGKMLYLDLRRDPPWSIKLQTNEWSKDSQVKPEKVKHLSRLPGVILVTEPIDCAGGECLEKLMGGLGEVMGGLQKHSSIVVVVENKGADGDREARIEILKQLGLAKPNVLRRLGKKRMIWEARKPKKTERPGVDLVASAKGKGDYLKKMAKIVKQQYLENGYEVIGWEEIFDRLSASKFPQGDIEKLKSGYGVSLRVSDCGCTVDMSLDGEWVNHHACGDSGCCFPTELPEREGEGQMYNLYEMTDTGISCSKNCEETLVNDVRLHTLGKTKTKLLINLVCPHHGVHHDKLEWVDNDKIINLEKRAKELGLK